MECIDRQYVGFPRSFCSRTKYFKREQHLQRNEGGKEVGHGVTGEVSGQQQQASRFTSGLEEVVELHD